MMPRATIALTGASMLSPGTVTISTFRKIRTDSERAVVGTLLACLQRRVVQTVGEVNFDLGVTSIMSQNRRALGVAPRASRVAFALGSRWSTLARSWIIDHLTGKVAARRASALFNRSHCSPLRVPRGVLVDTIGIEGHVVCA